MRRFLIALTVFAGAVAATPGAHAAPRSSAMVPTVSAQPTVQPVQYHGGGEEWRHREWRRREAYERFRRHEEWRHQRREAHERYHDHYRHGW